MTGDGGDGGEKVAFLVQGTSTPTWSSPAGRRGPRTSSPTTTSVGLPDDLEFELVEPLRTLFRTRSDWSASSSASRPRSCGGTFPGPGLGIRIIGEVTRERLDILREADAIAREELTRAAWTATSGSSRSCCSPTSAASASRATTAPTATRSCCVR